MAERIRYLVAYDVREPKRLRRVHQVAKNYGYSLQYSVFVCDLTALELLALKAAMSAEANLKVDSIAIFDLGPPRGRGIKCIEFLGHRRQLEDSAQAAVW
jgi:CRISPR-associated protein Cas2